MEIAIPKPWELHPVLVHFPIAFLIGGVAVMLWALIRPNEATHRVAAGLLVTGVISGWLAAASGGLAYNTVPAHTEVGHELMSWHLGFALTMLVLFSGVAIARWRNRSAQASIPEMVVVIIGSLLLIATGYLGGTIVFRHGAGVDPNILSAEIRGGHSHQDGHSQVPDQNSSAGHSVSGQHDMSGMKGMDHSAMKGVDDTQKPPTSHQHDMEGMADMADMPAMAHAATDTDEKETATSIEGLSQLSAADRALAAKQHICPVSGELIGSMGKPIKVTVKDREVWLCCDSCKKKLLESPDQYLSDKHDHNHSE